MTQIYEDEIFRISYVIEEFSDYINKLFLNIEIKYQGNIIEKEYQTYISTRENISKIFVKRCDILFFFMFGFFNFFINLLEGIRYFQLPYNFCNFCKIRRKNKYVFWNDDYHHICENCMYKENKSNLFDNYVILNRKILTISDIDNIIFDKNEGKISLIIDNTECTTFYDKNTYEIIGNFNTEV